MKGKCWKCKEEEARSLARAILINRNHNQYERIFHRILTQENDNIKNKSEKVKTMYLGKYDIGIRIKGTNHENEIILPDRENLSRELFNQALISIERLRAAWIKIVNLDYENINKKENKK